MVIWLDQTQVIHEPSVNGNDDMSSKNEADDKIEERQLF